MRSFSELEKSRTLKSVYSNGSEGRISGSIEISGRKTRVELESEHHLGTQTTEEGWFDLNLESEANGQVLLKNALVIGSNFNRAHSTWRQTLYPNIVIFHSERLGIGEAVHSVSFELKKMRHFFRYARLEHHFVHNDQSAFHEYLSTARLNDSKREYYPVPIDDYDFTDASEFYAVHSAPEPMSIEANGREYSVFLGSRTVGGFIHDLKIKSLPIATIRFDEPVSIEVALDEVWTWRRFFNQIAYTNLKMLGTYVSGSKGQPTQWAELYLPSEASRKSAQGLKRDFSSHHVPFSSWGERDLMMSMMKRWLDAEVERHRFRTFVDSVLRNSNRVHSFNDLMNLCAAIESLTSLTASSPLEKDKLTVMARAAHEVAPEYPEERIRGALGVLAHRSLKSKIMLLCELCNLTIDLNAIESIARHTVRLRTIAAHGNPSVPLDQPLLHPVSAALLALCVIYDLTSSGFHRNAVKSGMQLRAEEMLGLAIEQMNRLNKKSFKRA